MPSALTITLLLLLLAAVVTWRWKQRDDDEPDMSVWGWIREVLAPLLGGLFVLAMSLRALVTGRVDCSGKGACNVDAWLRDVHPGPYWFNVACLFAMAAIGLWAAWWGHRRRR